jgi:hypothetical protein
MTHYHGERNHQGRDNPQRADSPDIEDMYSRLERFFLYLAPVTLPLSSAAGSCRVISSRGEVHANCLHGFHYNPTESGQQPHAL